jgi:rhodanese-related sulfurtransferase
MRDVAMKTTTGLGVAVLAALLVGTSSRPAAPADDCALSVYQTTLNEPNPLTTEVTTEELLSISSQGSQPVLDVRFAEEYAIAHIPGSVNLYEKEAERVTQLFPDRTTRMVLYCNGPFCGKSKRTSEQLVQLGYVNVRRYQLGMPVWRALGNTVETTLEGVRYIWAGDRTAVWVDARETSQYARGTLLGAVSVRAGEADAANEDGRLPLKDKGTRVVVFGSTPQQARTVATQIARKAYWNSSYFGGTFDDIVHGGLTRDPRCEPR